LKVAAARTRKALAFADVSKAALSPQVNASASSTRERFSEHGLIPPPLGGSWSTVNELQVTLDWEIDFWGKNRAAYESAMGGARAAEVEAYAARLALSTNIAPAPVQLQRATCRRRADESSRIAIDLRADSDRNNAGIDRASVYGRPKLPARDPRADRPAAGDDSTRAI
jgi:outer membrane protein TolC